MPIVDEGYRFTMKKRETLCGSKVFEYSEFWMKQEFLLPYYVLVILSISNWTDIIIIRLCPS